jgi:hypothetical protein
MLSLILAMQFSDTTTILAQGLSISEVSIARQVYGRVVGMAIGRENRP